MKRSLLLIASLITMAGCSTEYTEGDNTLDNSAGKVSFRAAEPGVTRTSFDETTMTTSWAKGDKVSLWADKDGTRALSQVEFTASAINGSGAEFESYLTQMERGEYIYYSTYPAPSKMSGNIATFVVPTTQAGEYDCSADLLVAEPATALALTQKGANLQLAYRHVLHALKIEVAGGVDGYGNTIERIVLNFPNEVAGEMKLDITGENAPTVSGSKQVTINCTDKMAATGSAWAFIAPTDCSEGVFTISVTAAGHTNTFEVDGRNFREGYLSRVVVGMPEVLIIEQARTLIDNNSSRTITNPTEARLQVRLGGASSAEIINSGIEYVAQSGGDTIAVPNSLSMLNESVSFELKAANIASGIYSMRGYVELLGGKKIYSDMVNNVRVVGNFAVNLGDVKTSYSYYTSEGASVANSKSGTSIYTFTNSFNLNTAFIGSVEEVGVSVDNVDYAGAISGTSFNCGEISSQSWGKHTVEAYVKINGVRFASAKSTVDVTGLPYSVSTKASSLPSGWTGENLAWKGYGLGSGDGETCLRLKGESKTDQNSNGWIVSPSFHVPASMGVTATAHTYLYRASFTSTKGYLYAAASSGGYSTDTSNGIQKGSVVLFYTQASLNDFNYSLVLSTTQPRVTFYANNFTNPGDAWFTINRVDVKYR